MYVEIWQIYDDIMKIYRRYMYDDIENIYDKYVQVNIFNYLI